MSLSAVATGRLRGKGIKDACIAEGADSPEAEPCRGTKSYSTMLRARRAMANEPCALTARMWRFHFAVVEVSRVIRVAGLIRVLACPWNRTARVPVLRLRGTVRAEVCAGSICVSLACDAAIHACRTGHISGTRG